MKEQTRNTLKNTNTWWLNNTFLNNEQFTEEIRGINTFLETKNNENKMIKNLEDATKAVLKGKFVVIQSFLKKQEKSQTA